MKKLLILIVVLAAIVAGGPALTSSLAKDGLDAQVAAFNQMPGYKAEVVNYEKGWFNATAQLRVGIDAGLFSGMAAGNPALPQDVFEDMSVLFDLNIAHGPLLLNDGVGVGITSTVSALNEEMLPELTEFREKLGIDSIVTYQQVTNLLGVTNYVGAITAIEHSENGTSVSFDGAELAGSFDLKDSTMTTVGEIGKIHIVEKGQTILMEPIVINADMEFLNWAMQLGSTEMVMPGLKVYAGTDTSAEPMMTMDNLKISGISSRDSEDTIKSGATYSIDRIAGPGMNLQDVNLQMEIERFSTEALTQIFDLYMSGINNMADPEMMQMQMAMGAAQIAPQLLKYSPVLTISDLSFKFNDETMKSDVSVGIDAEGMDTVNLNPAELMQKLSASLNMEVSAGLAAMMGSQFGMDPESSVQMGMLVKTADGYRLEFSMKDGAATLNGQPMPLPL